MNPVQKWMSTATVAQATRLAKLAHTTLGNLRQIAGGYRESRVSADLAVRLDHAAAVLRSRDPSLPEIHREKLSAACANCEFAKRCRKE